MLREFLVLGQLVKLINFSFVFVSSVVIIAFLGHKVRIAVGCIAIETSSLVWRVVGLILGGVVDRLE